eukprot:jgi/Ulvmu1/12782/UM097_0009.1
MTMIHSVAAAVAAAMLLLPASAFTTKGKGGQGDKPDLDSLFASLPPQSSEPRGAGRGFSTTFIETSSAETKCESSAESAFLSDFRNAYISAVAKVVKKSCNPKFNDVERLKDDLVDFAFAWAEVRNQTTAMTTMTTMT